MGRFTMNNASKMITGLIAALFLGVAPATGASDDTIELAPNFTVASIFDGRQVSLDDFLGKVVYLDFWASWCGPCLKSFPFMEELHQQYSDQGLAIIAINLDQDPQDAYEFLKDHPVTFFVGQNSAGDIAEQYGVMEMPSTYIVDRLGLIKEVHYGFKSSDKEDIIALVASLL